jgi:hypothetical protein
MNLSTRYHDQDSRPLTPQEVKVVDSRKRAEAARLGHRRLRIERELAAAQAPAPPVAEAPTNLTLEDERAARRSAAATKAAATVRERKFKAECAAQAERRMGEIARDVVAEA